MTFRPRGWATTLLVVLAPASASAIPDPYSDAMVCGGDNFRTCASLSITWSGTTATIHIRNVGVQGEVFTAFGFTHLPAGTSVTGSTIDPRLAGRFVQGAANDIQAVGFVATQPAPQTGLRSADNTAGPFVFTLSFSALTPAEILALDFSIHAQSGPDGCSTKLIIAPNGVQNGLTGDLPTLGCRATVVPEPFTMTLLATGLGMLGGAAATRKARAR